MTWFSPEPYELNIHVTHQISRYEILLLLRVPTLLPSAGRAAGQCGPWSPLFFLVFQLRPITDLANRAGLMRRFYTTTWKQVSYRPAPPGALDYSPSSDGPCQGTASARRRVGRCAFLLDASSY